MRLVRRARRRLAIVVAVAIVVWGPAYARGLSLVVRAAHLDGWLRRAADFQARPWQAGPAQTIPTRHGAIPARIYRPHGTIATRRRAHARRARDGDRGAAPQGPGRRARRHRPHGRHDRVARSRALPLHAAVRRPDRGRREVAAGAARPRARRQGRPDGHQLRRRPVARRRGPPVDSRSRSPTCSRSAATATCRAR